MCELSTLYCADSTMSYGACKKFFVHASSFMVHVYLWVISWRGLSHYDCRVPSSR